jgi:hypothetical protein
MSIERRNSSGVLLKTIKVPLSYSTKDKIIQRFKQNTDLNNTFRTTLPRMAFVMTSLSYDGTRKQNSLNTTKIDSTGLVSNMMYSPAPYNLDFELNIWTSHFEDSLQIVEQILPFFQPEYTIAIDEIPSLGIVRDIPIVLNDVSYSDDAEGNFEDVRTIEWTLTFTLKGYMFGPIKTSKIIKQTDTDVFTVDFNSSGEDYRSTVSPLGAMETDPHTIVDTQISIPPAA